MIITRTPFRITLGGGGTDLKPYYELYGGFIFSAALDKYMFINSNRPVADDLIRVKYTRSETVKHIDQLQHDLAREIFRFTNIDSNIEISSLSDIPAGTGLGSSSCYAVGLLHAMHTLKRDYVPLSKLAEEDFYIETEVLKRPIGKQDPYLAAYGGLTVLDIAKDGKVTVRSANVSHEIADELNRNILLFYTGTTRSADNILKEQQNAILDNNISVVDSMHYIKDLGRQILNAVESGNIDVIGKKFNEHWQYKKKISKQMTNPHFDAIYEAALVRGALGGKLSGAGGGGFFTFYVPEKQREFRLRMRELNLREMRYHFDFEGTKILANFQQR